MQIERKRGDTAPITATVTAQRSRTPANITGSVFKLTVDSRMAPDDSTSKLFELTGNIVDAERGVVEFSLTSEQADHVGFFYYDIQMTDSYGKIHTLDCDSFVMSQDITK